MPEIKIEHPAGRHSAEMLLVGMLSEKRSWNDYMDITRALRNLRQRAESMEKERDIHRGGNSTGENLASEANKCE